MVSDKRTIEEVLPEFVDFIEDLPLVAHNARFDMGFLLCGYVMNVQSICTVAVLR